MKRTHIPLMARLATHIPCWKSLKKGLPRLLAGLACGALLACIAMPVTARVVIKVGTVAPEGSVWHDGLLRMRQQWREASGGQVELRIYAGGVLGSEEELVRKMQRRALDAAALTSAGLPALDKSFTCLNVPMLFESLDNLRQVRVGAAPLIEREVDGKGFKVLNWAPAGWVQIFAKVPVRTPDDLRERRIWTSGGDPDTERLYKSFGFQAVPLPATELLTSLQTGLIDAMPLVPLFAMLERGYTVADHMTVLNWTPLSAATVISNRAWARIPAGLQPRLLAIARAEGDALAVHAERAGDDAVREMRMRGLKVIQPTAAELAQWRSASENAYPVYRGMVCPAPIFDEVIRLDREYEAGHRR